MTSEIIPAIEKNEAIASPTNKKYQYQCALAMLGHGVQLVWVAQFLRAAALHDIQQKELYLDEFETWDAFCLSIKSNHQMCTPLAKFGGMMKKFCIEKRGYAGEDFIFTEQIIKDCFGHLFQSNRRITRAELAASCESLSTFESFLAGNNVFSEKDVNKLLEGPKRAVDELPPANAFPKDIPTGLMKKLYENGFSYDGKVGDYVDKNGNIITKRQLGLFVEEDDAFKIFDEVDKAVNRAEEQISELMRVHGKHYAAYILVHDTPLVKQKSKEAFERLREKQRELKRWSFYIAHDEDFNDD